MGHLSSRYADELVKVHKITNIEGLYRVLKLSQDKVKILDTYIQFVQTSSIEEGEKRGKKELQNDLKSLLGIRDMEEEG